VNDVVVYPARSIITMDPAQPRVDAVAVSEGRVLAAGSLEECCSWGRHTIDRRFAEHVIVPGMIEAHAHSLEGAFSLLPYVGWFDRHAVDGGTTPGIRTYDALLERLRRLDAATAGSDEPIVVGGFDPIYFRDEERLDRRHLDAVSTERPIFVFHASAHLATVNTAMLERHEITRDSTTPGVARDDHGDPNGELQEMPAMALASSGLMVILRTLEDPAAIDALGQICANQGIASLSDLAASGLQRPDSQDRWRDKVDRGDFPARILQRHIAAIPPGAATWDDAAEALAELAATDTGKLRSVGLKVLLDGSIQGFTAKMDWPGYYTGVDHGMWMTPPEQLFELCRG
jgi:predicted amidohydrolase YtcJ